MKSGTRIGLAVGLGYVLGRRRRLRTALTLAAAVAAGRMSRDPAGLSKLGELLPGSPHLHSLSRLGAPLVGAGRAAAAAAVGSGIDSVSDRLRSRADALRGKTRGGSDDDVEQQDEASDDERSSRRSGDRSSGKSGERSGRKGGERSGGKGGERSGRKGGRGADDDSLAAQADDDSPAEQRGW
ncbi:hypothetical protein GA0074692_5690 [Micromonospora pallida]|uniref:Uncharacterized protein n=1 Tax=Micromonospora pallida TaxID=145854 RepID=A0A1C6TFF1_9ACTN|nr:hypothetical protein [Micromonospora pallida]SCL40233.1 hypothetical protein GA0074692_5690 [Micromonospora pallida]